MSNFEKHRKKALPKQADRDAFDEATNSLINSPHHERTRDAASSIVALKNLTRRAFMLSSAAAVAGLNFELEYGLTRVQDEILDSLLGRHEEPFEDPHPSFIASLDRYRADRGRTELLTQTPEQEWLKLAVDNSMHRHPHRHDIFENLKLIIGRSRHDEVRAYAGNLAATSLTRVGDTTQASELLIASTNVEALDDRAAFFYRVELCMEQFVGLQIWEWDKPSGWPLQLTLAALREQHTAAFDFDVMDTRSPHFDVKLTSRLAAYGIPFVHAHFFAMQAATAAMPDPEQRHTFWSRQMDFYRRVIAVQKNVGVDFRKTIWNHLVCLFIQAAKYGDIEYRRFFFGLLSGESDRTFIERLTGDQLSGEIGTGDHMYILFVIAANTVTWNEKGRILTGPLGEQLRAYIGIIELMPNPTICAALDMFRKLLGMPLGVKGPSRRYAVRTGGFDHYVIDFRA